MIPRRFSLLDVVHNENRLSLVFEFLDRDLKRYMDLVAPNDVDPTLVKVRRAANPPRAGHIAAWDAD